MLKKEIIQEIERYAPPTLQEKWDNTGLQVGTLSGECTGVLICFDVTPRVVEEAIARDCNLVISHHPLFFKPIKRLTGETPQQICAINAVTAGISIYSSHTAMDSTVGGVSYTLAKKIGVNPIRVLSPMSDKMIHLRVYIPVSHVEEVTDALHDIGAGSIGDYDFCSFRTEGIGTFRPLNGAEPYIGTQGNICETPEVAVDMVLDADLMRKAEQVIREVHPYEQPAYSFMPMLNKRDDIGLGIYGTCESELTATEFLRRIKDTLGVSTLRVSKFDAGEETKIRRVAMCGGAGGEFIPTAIASGAQVYISGDIRYHDFTDYGEDILIVDAGHFHTEQFIKETLRDLIKDKYPDLETVYCTGDDDDPIKYV